MKIAMGAHRKKLASALALGCAAALAFAGAAPAAHGEPGDAPPALSIGDWIPPEGASEKPKPEAWEKAAPLSLARPHARCTASAIREWVRVACLYSGDEFEGVRVVGGSEKDVEITNGKATTAEKKPMNVLGIVLPVRRGDRRLLTVVRWESGGWKSFYIREDTAITISELWLPGDRGPAIVVH